MSFIETRCRLCTEEIRIKSVGFHDTDVDRLKYKFKLKILFEDLVLEEDDTTPFVLCLFCVEKIRNTFEFRKQCLDAYQFWGIHFGHDQSKSLDLNFKIIPSVDNQFTRYEFIATQPPKMDSPPPINEIKKEMTDDPVPLVGNMKNKLSSLLKLGPLEAKTKVESPEPAPILSLTLLGQKCTYKNKKEPPKSVMKPILNIDKLKQNLNKRISIPMAVDIKSEPDDDDDMPLKTLKRKLSDINAAKNSPVKLDIFNLKNKLGTALKIGETLQEKQEKPKERRTKKHGFIVDINHIIADKKNNIYYCKYCYKYFQNVVALRYHVVQHGKSKQKKIEKVQKIETPPPPPPPPPPQQKSVGKKTTQCDICQNWFINVQTHKSRAHKNTDKKTEKHKK